MDENKVAEQIKCPACEFIGRTEWYDNPVNPLLDDEDYEPDEMLCTVCMDAYLVHHALELTGDISIVACKLTSRGMQKLADEINGGI